MVCIKCQKSKADRQSREMKLIPMRTGERPCENTPMDFVGELPQAEDFNAIHIVKDRSSNV